MQADPQLIMGVFPLYFDTVLCFNIEFCWFICEIDLFTKSFHSNFFHLLQQTSTVLSAVTQYPLSPKLLLNPFWMNSSPSLYISPDCTVLKNNQILKWMQAIYHTSSVAPILSWKCEDLQNTHQNMYINCNSEMQSILTLHLLSQWIILGILTISDAQTGWYNFL